MKYERIIKALSVLTPLFLLIGDVFAETNELYVQVEKYYIYFVQVGVAIGIFVVIYGGSKIFFSAGNASKLSQGKKIVIGALFGLFLLVGSYVVIYVINPAILNPGEIKVEAPVDGTIYGLYLVEDSVNREVFLKNSMTSLGDVGANQKVDRYFFKQPPPEESDERYAAIFFSDADYRGECYWGSDPAEDGTQDGTPPFKPSSVFVFKTKGAGGSPVYVINNDNGECNDLGKIGESFYPETLEVNAYGSPQELKDKDHWIEVPAIRIESKEVLVLLITRDFNYGVSTEAEDGEVPASFHCQLIRKVTDSENCQLVKYDYVYHTDSVDTVKPGYIKLFNRVPTDTLY